MRLQIISDLHVDVIGGFTPSLAAGADTVVVAGDVQEGVAGALAFLRRHIPRPTPIVFVLGNHEFYGRAIDEERSIAIEASREHDIAVLDDSAVVIGSVRFVGATLWTDFCLHGQAAQANDMEFAYRMMSDFERIKLRNWSMQLLLPQSTVEMHHASRAFIRETLERPFEGPTVVVTHHAPHERSIHARFQGSALNPAFISDQSALISRFSPALWVHGHVHNSFDYRLGATRVVANPHGYGYENPAFDPQLVIEV